MLKLSVSDALLFTISVREAIDGFLATVERSTEVSRDTSWEDGWLLLLEDWFDPSK